MAIAFDTSAALTRVTGTSLTQSYTNNGDLLVVQAGTVGDLISGVTYNGVSMTQLTKVQNANLGSWIYMFYLIAPATGANNIVISHTGVGLIEGNAASYSGTNQSSFPDSSNTNRGTGTSFSTSTTVVASNCWLVGFLDNDNTATTGTSNWTKRQEQTDFVLTLADSNGTVGTGSQTQSGTIGGSANWGMITASFAPPAPVVATATGHFLSLMGVGS